MKIKKTILKKFNETWDVPDSLTLLNSRKPNLSNDNEGYDDEDWEKIVRSSEKDKFDPEEEEEEIDTKSKFTSSSEEEEIEEEEEEEEGEPESEDDEDMDHLLYLLRQLFTKYDMKNFELDYKGLDIFVYVLLKTKSKLSEIVKIFEILNKIKEEILPQYESDYEMWETKKKEPLLVFNFFLETEEEKKKKATVGPSNEISNDDERNPYTPDEPPSRYPYGDEDDWSRYGW